MLGSFLHQGWGEFRMKADKRYRVSVAILGSAAVKRHFIPVTLLLPIFLRKRCQPESLRISFQFGMKRTTACNAGRVYLNQKSGWIVSLPNLYFNYSNWLESYKVCQTFTKGRKLGEQGWKQLLGKKKMELFQVYIQINRILDKLFIPVTCLLSVLLHCNIQESRNCYVV